MKKRKKLNLSLNKNVISKLDQNYIVGGGRTLACPANTAGCISKACAQTVEACGTSGGACPTMACPSADTTC